MPKRTPVDPIITQAWVDELSRVSKKLARLSSQTDEAREELGNMVRAGFAQGIPVGPMIEATGLSSSRLYQIKFAHRDHAKAINTDMPA